MYGSQLRHYPEQFGKFLARYVVEHPFAPKFPKETFLGSFKRVLWVVKDISFVFHAYVCN